MDGAWEGGEKEGGLKGSGWRVLLYCSLYVKLALGWDVGALFSIVGEG